MFTTLCTCSRPSTRSCSPGRVRVSTSVFHNALNRISLTSVLLPDPEAPVIATSIPRGNLTSIDLRLFSRAARTIRLFPFPLRRFLGKPIERLPDKYWPVGDALHRSEERRVG